MTESIRELLPHIQDHALFRDHDFRLVGGTALSYHLEHRISEDLDFCTVSDLPLDSIAGFISDCVDVLGEENVDFIAPAQGVIDDFEIHGERVEDYLQNWKIGNVRVTFFDGREGTGTREILAENDFTTIGNIRIAGPETIFKLKSLMFYKRSKSRDLFDMLSFYGLNDPKYSPQETKRLIEQYEPAYRGKEGFALWLHAFEHRPYDRYRDEGLHGLTHEVKSFDEMKKEILELFERLV
ncbi:nucleotidyl transferase AbiEii/AbiGii toxin family protein [Thiomicrolovo sp. ZZH C-3]